MSWKGAALALPEPADETEADLVFAAFLLDLLGEVDLGRSPLEVRALGIARNSPIRVNRVTNHGGLAFDYPN